jgi:glycosyltransferase involved in cell wall biosynthesis
MSLSNEKLAIVIPTFQRACILRGLLSDLLDQTVLPDILVIVDGDPKSAKVLSMLKQVQFPSDLAVIYIPSNHGNEPYQRYLGVRAAKDCQVLISIDDDIRFTQKDVIKKIFVPFLWEHRHIVGVTPKISFPSREKLKRICSLVKYLGFMQSSHRLSPGKLTPFGDRIPPVDSNNDYDPVSWLRGGVMAYRTEALLKAIYSEDIFALSYIRCGLGTDTYLSRQVGLYGELLQANCAKVEHPDIDSSKISPSNMKQLGYARAYSRRFLNDHYRLNEPPRILDRVALAKSYLWAFLVNWMNVFGHSRLSYAWGYTLGIIDAITKCPIAKNLAPQINWQADAYEALSQQVKIQ